MNICLNRPAGAVRLLCAMMVVPTLATAETEVNVTAERAALPRFEVGSAVSSLSAAQLQKFSSVADALATLPGLSFTRNGGEGAVTAVRIRGLNTAQVLVLIDGMRVNDPSDPSGAYNFANLPTDSIERIEVVRGPQSALYGGDAMAGVINIITKRGAGAAGVSTRFEGGSRGTFGQRADVSGSTDRVDYRLSESTRTVGGFSRTDFSPDRDPSNNRSASANVGVKLGGGVSVRGQVERADLTYHYDDPWDMKRDQISHDERMTSALSVHYDPDVASTSQLRVYNNTIERRYATAPASKASSSTYNGDRVGVEAQTRYAFTPQHAVTLGGETRKEHADFTSFYGAGAYSYITTAGFAQYAFNSSDGRLHVTPGVRLDHNDAFGNFTTGRLAASYKLPSDLGRLHASIGTAAKVPALDQLYAKDYGNRSLNPERSTGEDLGWAFDALGGRLNTDVTVFNNDVRQMIIGSKPPFYQYINIARARTRGVENTARFALTDDLTLDAAYTYTASEDRDTGLALLNVPKHTLSGGVSYVWGDFTLSPRVRYASGSRGYGGADNKPYAVLDADVRYDASRWFGHKVGFFVRGENLLDRNYQEVRGYNAAPFGIFAGGDVRF